jgi:hypothetical protein
MRTELKIISSKGDSFLIKDPIKANGDDEFVYIESNNGGHPTFDKVARDRSITILLWSDNGVRANPSGD